jgi:hypothetical protein
MTRKLTRAKETEWIVLRSQQSVLVFPDISFTGWICEEAGREIATEDGHAILCDACFASYGAGAEIVEGA